MYLPLKYSITTDNTLRILAKELSSGNKTVISKQLKRKHFLSLPSCEDDASIQSRIKKISIGCGVEDIRVETVGSSPQEAGGHLNRDSDCKDPHGQKKRLVFESYKTICSFDHEVITYSDYLRDVGREFFDLIDKEGEKAAHFTKNAPTGGGCVETDVDELELTICYLLSSHGNMMSLFTVTVDEAAVDGGEEKEECRQALSTTGGLGTYDQHMSDGRYPHHHGLLSSHTTKPKFDVTTSYLFSSIKAKIESIDPDLIVFCDHDTETSCKEEGLRHLLKSLEDKTCLLDFRSIIDFVEFDTFKLCSTNLQEAYNYMYQITTTELPRAVLPRINRERLNFQDHFRQPQETVTNHGFHNMVYSYEKPYGFDSLEEAIAETDDGMVYFARKLQIPGISPIFKFSFMLSLPRNGGIIGVIKMIEGQPPTFIRRGSNLNKFINPDYPLLETYFNTLLSLKFEGIILSDVSNIMTHTPSPIIHQTAGKRQTHLSFDNLKVRVKVTKNNHHTYKELMTEIEAKIFSDNEYVYLELWYGHKGHRMTNKIDEIDQDYYLEDMVSQLREFSKLLST